MNQPFDITDLPDQAIMDELSRRFNAFVMVGSKRAAVEGTMADGIFMYVDGSRLNCIGLNRVAAIRLEAMFVAEAHRHSDDNDDIRPFPPT